MGDESGFQVDEEGPLLYEGLVGRFMAPFVEALVSASVSRGDSVLDVACGTGFAARAAAAIAGPSGCVVGSDINGSMLAAAESSSGNGGIEIAWRQASALDLPFADREFDTVICQQGVQFFPDVTAGLSEMGRVTRPGGRLAVTVWVGSGQCPFFATEDEMLVRFCGLDSAKPAAGYVHGGRQEVVGWFESAGLGDASVEVVETVVPIPPVLDFVPQHLAMLPWSAEFSRLGVQRQRRALAWMDEQLSPYRTIEGYDVPFRSYLAVTGV